MSLNRVIRRRGGGGGVDDLLGLSADLPLRRPLSPASIGGGGEETLVSEMGCVDDFCFFCKTFSLTTDDCSFLFPLPTGEPIGGITNASTEGGSRGEGLEGQTPVSGLSSKCQSESESKVFSSST